jgi:DNA topoisomerase II
MPMSSLCGFSPRERISSVRRPSVSSRASTKYSVIHLLLIYIAIDEILVNAADNIQRDKKTSVIKVNID